MKALRLASRQAPEAASPPVVVTRPASPDDLLAFWPFIRGGLQVIKQRQVARCKRLGLSPATWHPEHVRAALLRHFLNQPNGAELWLGFVEGEASPVAFAITQPCFDNYLSMEMGLFIWFSYAKPLRGLRAVEEMGEALADVARARGYAYMQGITSRKGYARRAAGSGYKVLCYVLQRELFPV